MLKKALSSVWKFFVGFGESVQQARMEQAKHYMKNRMWE
jgi:hypothetical protein